MPPTFCWIHKHTYMLALGNESRSKAYFFTSQHCMTNEFTHNFHIVLQWIPSNHSYMLTLVAPALFSFSLNGLPLIAMVEQLLLPAWGSSNMTFTNETDDNPAEVKLRSQDSVDNGTRDNLFRWIYGSSEDERLNYHNLPIIYLCVCRNNHTNYIFHHSICGWDTNGTDESKLIWMYIYIFIIIMNYGD